MLITRLSHIYEFLAPASLRILHKGPTYPINIILLKTVIFFFPQVKVLVNIGLFIYTESVKKLMNVFFCINHPNYLYPNDSIAFWGQRVRDTPLISISNLAL